MASVFVTPPTAAAVITSRRRSWRRLRAPLVTVAALGAATTALAFRDPHQHGSWGLCPSAALGLSCPFCGSLRAVNDLTHGDVVAAASSNLLLVAAMPFAILALAIWLADAWRGTRRTINVPVPAVWVVVTLVAAFTVLRNIPGSWLAP